MQNIFNVASLFVVFAFFFQFHSEALAMRCSLPTAAELVKEAEFVFVGKAVTVQPIKEKFSKTDLCWVWSPEKQKCGSKRVKFKVLRSFKGLKKGEVITFLAGDGCYCGGGYIDEGEDRLVFAKRGQKGDVKLQQISDCLGMQPANGKLFDEILAATGKKKENAPRTNKSKK